VPSIDFIRAYLADVRVRLRRQFAAAALYSCSRRGCAGDRLPLVALALSPGRATSLALVAGLGSSGSWPWSPPSSAASWAPLKRFGTDDAVARWIGARHRRWRRICCRPSSWRAHRDGAGALVAR
jgi:hypothetical protein